GPENPFGWLFLSDVCKHCGNAGCLEACPTAAIFRTEVGSIYVQDDVCNGCGYCVVGCPLVSSIAARTLCQAAGELSNAHSAMTARWMDSRLPVLKSARPSPFYSD